MRPSPPSAAPAGRSRARTSDRRLAPWVVALAAGLLTGCFASDSELCASSDDCRAEQLCQLGTCFAACSSDSACASDQRCVDGLCLDAERCITNADCAFGTVCEDRLCRSQQPECSRDTECPPGTLCIEGACLVDPQGQLECVTPDDCAPDQDCVNNRCLDGDLDGGAPDAGADVATDPDPADVDVSDVTPDGTPDGNADAEPDTADTVECVFNGDCPGGELCVDGVCRPPSTDAGTDAEPDVATCGAYLDECSAASQCCSDLCVPDFAGAASGFCTQDCSSWGACNPTGTDGSRACLPVDDGGATRNVCVGSDWDRDCASAGACLAGICLRTASTSSCSWTCDAAADCPDGAACGLVGFAGDVVQQVCTPIGNPCISEAQCLSGTCLTDDGGGLGYCSTFCDPRGTADCPAGFACSAPDPLQPSLYVCVLP